MFKKRRLTKDGFVEGAFVSTSGIVISKILGMLYVIPFYALIKDRGGALYGYAYTIYMLFLALSTAGIPLAISKIISEYQTLGYYKTKERTFRLAKRLALLLGLICFIILFFAAPLIAKIILGNNTGGNSISDVVHVIRIIDTAILIVPILSVYRGYLSGHRYLTPSSVSNVIEQIVRVTVIILGSLLSVKVFHLKLHTTVGIALFGATLGALVAFFYLASVVYKNRGILSRKIMNTKEPKISNKIIIRKILIYAIPFIMIDLSKSIYDFVDMSTVVRTISDMKNYTSSDAEVIMSVISTWGSKFNMIISAISTGIMASLIPNLTQSFVKKDQDEINKKVNKTFQMLLVFTVPMTIGLSLLSKPIWFLFYGSSKLGPSVFSFYIFIALFVTTFTVAITILQIFKDYKAVLISLLVGIILKVLLNVTFMENFNSMGLPPYYGNITATILGYFSSLLVCLYFIKKKYKVNYESTLKEVINIIFSTLFMVVSVILLRFVLPSYSLNRLLNIPIIFSYTFVGGLVYFIIVHKSNTLKNIFGKNYLDKLLSKNKKM